MPKTTKAKRESATLELIDTMRVTTNIILIPEFMGTGTGSVARYRYCVHIQTPRNMVDVSSLVGYALGHRVTVRNNNPTSFVTTDKPRDIMEAILKTFPVLAKRGVTYNVIGHSMHASNYTMSIDTHEDVKGFSQSLDNGVLTIRVEIHSN